jgi:phosphatidylserine decarboxylase
MKISTKNSLFGKFFDAIGMNKSFHKYEKINYDKKSKIISPVEAKIVKIDKINKEGYLISKNNKNVSLKKLIGDYSKYFVNGSYINFYLNPKNKHFWITPCEGKFVYTQKNEGKSFIPSITGIENLFGIEMFPKSVKKNASIGSILNTKDSKIAMIAVGSLNVNRITADYQEGINYKKGVPCGYFSLGSSMLLCFQKPEQFLVKEGDLIKIGQRILK